MTWCAPPPAWTTPTPACRSARQARRPASRRPAAPASADPMYAGAVSVVMGSGKASIALVQRHLKIGYNRAARLVEDMERAGLVSPMGTDGARSVLKPLAEIPNTETAARDRQATQDALAAANLAAGVLPGDTLSPNGTRSSSKKWPLGAAQDFPGNGGHPHPGRVRAARQGHPSRNATRTPPPMCPSLNKLLKKQAQTPGAQGAAPAKSPASQPAPLKAMR
ncbi:Cell division protein FtsK [Polaromonas sp. CG9_12]|nr:Cell division protein FtsK [Polaromonas sp. CG9_12]